MFYCSIYTNIKMITICWDVDDVLNNLMQEWFTYYKYINLDKYDNICFNNLIENSPNDILSITKKEYLESLDYFRMNYYKDLKPNEIIYEWFKEKGHLSRHMVLTATPLSCCNISAEWVMRYYGKWIRSFNFIPSPRENDSSVIYYKSKMEYLKRTNVDIFVDDNEETINEVNKYILQIKTFCPKMPWNNGILSDVELLNELNCIMGV